MFRDRPDAAAQLLRRLDHLRGEDAVVLGLPRGGVPVAAVVAEGLGVPLDVIVVRKLGLPFQPEVAMGAIGEGGVRLVNSELVGRAGVSIAELSEVERHERATLDRRVAMLRRGAAPRSLEGRTAIVVDDGLATGSTAEVACRVARSLGAHRVVLAIPIGPEDAASRVPSANEVVCVESPHWFHAVGQGYEDFSPTSDEEVMLLLDAAERRLAGEPWRPARSIETAQVEVPHGGLRLAADLSVPEAPTGFVVFAHGSGSSRHSPRNRLVADALQRAGLGTLLPDLLLPHEEADRANVFDIPLLADRLVSAVAWLRAHPGATGLPIGYFGASTGGGAALWAASEPGAHIAAIVSRGGRPDLAGERLGSVRAPTLLIVGGADHQVIELNRWAQARIAAPCELEIVPGATHLFEEAGTLAEVAILARDWFLRHFAPSAPAAGSARSAASAPSAASAASAASESSARSGPGGPA
ncbi:phosphoribosyltransferase family protein [Agromyces aurantiacus]|uniref:Phosphoribosyltransferase family protein n=1 Tax=Agromyces aurantiacus TaxID=165814 RepID=A0ABV9R6C4_9MICO|nr:phosphoribosyltransferase family protein [Agromyces aurantiacus]MBM7502585.1 putative phosphoribosyl transferase [Agromyces aurantiacus]